MAELTINEGFEKIEDILGQMEAEGVTLEDSFKLYEEGMKQLKACNDKIEEVEQKIQVMNQEGKFVNFEEED